MSFFFFRFSCSLTNTQGFLTSSWAVQTLILTWFAGSAHGYNGAGTGTVVVTFSFCFLDCKCLKEAELGKRLDRGKMRRKSCGNVVKKLS